jgi:N-acetylglucosamine malate deacetylase 1
MQLRHFSLARHPRTFMDSILTYPRFLGAIKPDLLTDESEFEARLACLRSSWWPAKLRCPIGRRLLAISPHPDDETIGAGGLLLAHGGQADISVITVFNGDGGGLLQGVEHDATDYKKHLREARLEELGRACQHFSGRVIGSLGLADGTIPAPIGPAADRLRELVDLARPDVVILPWLLDQQADHRTANLLWATSCANLPCMVLGSEIWSFVPANAYFDITEMLARKLAAISEFKTQLATVDYISLAEGLAKVRAFHGSLHERRAGAAESFLALPNKQYSELVLGLLACRDKNDRAEPTTSNRFVRGS